MAIETTLTSPDGATVITLKATKIIMDLSADIIMVSTANKLVVDVDIGRRHRTFTLTGWITVDGAVSAKKQVENLETAIMTWQTQTQNNGRALWKWGTKDDASAKTYRVRITKLSISDSPEELGGVGDKYTFVMVLAEVGSLSTIGSTA